MRVQLCPLFTAVLLFVAARPSVAQRSARDTLWLISSDSAKDLVHASDSEASLRDRLGAANVASAPVNLGEGEYEPGTILFPNDSLRRLTMIWDDTLHKMHPTRVRVDAPHTLWFVPPGVSLGASLLELEQLNGRAFTLFGFGWDYSGTVASWEGGRLDSLWKPVARREPLVWVRLQPVGSVDESLTLQVLGDRVYSSSLPAMQRLNPRVYDLFVTPR